MSHERMRGGGGGWWMAALLAILAGAPSARAQALRFSNHREVAVPPYALVRIGPFYSTLSLSQSAGFRWVRTTGSGTDYIFDNRLGEVREDGTDFPLITTVTMRNYLLVTRRMDIDFSITAMYRYFPMDTQPDEFIVNLTEEGVYGTLSASFFITPYIRGTLYDNLVYKTDYVDPRGLDDRQGGEAIEYLSNRVGVNLDWLLARNKNLLLSASRLDYLVFTDEFKDQERTEYQLLGGYQQRIREGFILGGSVGYTLVTYGVPERPQTSQIDYRLTTEFGRGGEGGPGLRLTEATTLKLGIGYSVGYEGTAAETIGDTNYVSRTYSSGDRQALTLSASLLTRVTRHLQQELSYEHGLRGGFQTSFEIFDRYGYSLTYQRNAFSARGYTYRTEVQVDDTGLYDYSDWTTGLDLTLPVTRAIALKAGSAYSVRGNSGGGQLDNPELDTDYQTWTHRIGTEFMVTRKLLFATYFMRVERSSEDEDLAYQRDILEAYFLYTHQF